MAFSRDGRLAAGVIPLGNGDARRPDGPAWLGVRPEDLFATAGGPPLGEVTLEVVEQMGHESLGYFRLGGERCAMRLAPDSGLSAGARLTPRLRENSWRLFADDAEGRRIN